MRQEMMEGLYTLDTNINKGPFNSDPSPTMGYMESWLNENVWNIHFEHFKNVVVFILITLVVLMLYCKADNIADAERNY